MYFNFLFLISEAKKITTVTLVTGHQKSDENYIFSTAFTSILIFWLTHQVGETKINQLRKIIKPLQHFLFFNLGTRVFILDLVQILASCEYIVT